MKNMIRIVKQGAPHYVAPWYKSLTPSGKRMIGTPTEPMYRTSPRQILESNATSYAIAILTQRGNTIPKGHINVEMGYVGNEMRARSVVWQTGDLHRQRWGADKFHATGEALRFDIPNWDHVPTVRDLSVSFAIAAE